MKLGMLHSVRQMQEEQQDSMAGGAFSRAAMLERAVAELEAACVRSPHDEAELLAAHVLGVSRAELATVEVFPAERVAEFWELVGRRAQRVPSARLVGTVRIGPIDIAVGPGSTSPRSGPS
jgi:release factor glutamine methyltransferase